MDPFLSLLQRFTQPLPDHRYASAFEARQQWFIDQISLAGTYYLSALACRDDHVFVVDRASLRLCHEICRFLLAMPRLLEGWRAYAYWYLATGCDCDGLVVYSEPLLREARAVCESVERRLGYSMDVGYRIIDALLQLEGEDEQCDEFHREEVGVRVTKLKDIDRQEMREGIIGLEEIKWEEIRDRVVELENGKPDNSSDLEGTKDIPLNNGCLDQQDAVSVGFEHDTCGAPIKQ